jgi:hypothetical protein
MSIFESLVMSNGVRAQQRSQLHTRLHMVSVPLPCLHTQLALPTRKTTRAAAASGNTLKAR